jgi:hypothetical protein
MVVVITDEYSLAVSADRMWKATYDHPSLGLISHDV